MKRTTRLILVLVVAALFLSACGIGGRNALIGKWVESQSGMSLEFTTDGRMRQYDPSQGATNEIPYQFLNDTTFVLKTGAASGGQEQSIAFAVNNDKLTLDVGGGQQLTMARVK